MRLRYQLNQAQPQVNPDKPNDPPTDTTHTLAFGEINISASFDGSMTLSFSGINGSSVPIEWTQGHWLNGHHVVRTPTFLVYPNKPASLFLALALNTGEQYSVHGQDSSTVTVDFSDTFGVAGNGPVFNNLPAGVTPTSPNILISGNALQQPVPVPGAVCLFASALGLSGTGRWRWCRASQQTRNRTAYRAASSCAKRCCDRLAVDDTTP